jgi:methionine-rich copper-binding protein CopC
MKLFRFLSLVLAAIFLANPAFAHSSLVSATPEPNATLLEVPSEVRLEFNENLLLIGGANPNKVEIFDSSGNLVSGATTIENQFALALINSGTAPGNFTVKYRVVSGDGHPIEGEYQFAVATPEVISAPVEVEPAEDGPNLLIRAVWALLLISLVGTVALLRRR